ncbi:MAG: hypothetical protein Q9224_000336 [Gallowayella concinna]
MANRSRSGSGNPKFTLTHPIYRTIHCLLRWRVVPKLLDPYRFLHLIRPLLAQIARLMFRWLRAERFILLYRLRDDGDRTFEVESVDLIVLASVGEFALDMDVKGKREEGGESVLYD